MDEFDKPGLDQAHFMAARIDHNKRHMRPLAIEAMRAFGEQLPARVELFRKFLQENPQFENACDEVKISLLALTAIPEFKHIRPGSFDSLTLVRIGLPMFLIEAAKTRGCQVKIDGLIDYFARRFQSAGKQLVVSQARISELTAAAIFSSESMEMMKVEQLAESTKEGQKMPDFTVQGIDGKVLDVEATCGKKKDCIKRVDGIIESFIEILRDYGLEDTHQYVFFCGDDLREDQVERIKEIATSFAQDPSKPGFESVSEHWSLYLLERLANEKNVVQVPKWFIQSIEHPFKRKGGAWLECDPNLPVTSQMYFDYRKEIRPAEEKVKRDQSRPDIPEVVLFDISQAEINKSKLKQHLEQKYFQAWRKRQAPICGVLATDLQIGENLGQIRWDIMYIDNKNHMPEFTRPEVFKTWQQNAIMILKFSRAYGVIVDPATSMEVVEGIANYMRLRPEEHVE